MNMLNTVKSMLADVSSVIIALRHSKDGIIHELGESLYRVRVH